MNLQDFIRETLVEIACGVHEAKISVKDLVSIAPGTVAGVPHDGKTEIEFDVAVTAQEKVSKQGEITGKIEPVIKVLSATISGGLFGGSFNWGRDKSKEEVQRIKFSIPIVLNAHHRNDIGFDNEISAVKSAVKKVKQEKNDAKN